MQSSGKTYIYCVSLDIIYFWSKEMTFNSVSYMLRNNFRSYFMSKHHDESKNLAHGFRESILKFQEMQQEKMYIKHSLE